MRLRLFKTIVYNGSGALRSPVPLELGQGSGRLGRYLGLLAADDVLECCPRPDTTGCGRRTLACMLQVNKVGNFSKVQVKQLRSDLKALYDKVKNRTADSDQEELIAVRLLTHLPLQKVGCM